MWLSILTTLILGSVLLFFQGRNLLLVLRRVSSRYLNQRTAERRKQLLERSQDEENAQDAKSRNSTETSDEWETVDSYAIGTAENGKTAELEWDGVVGLFHPFW